MQIDLAILINRLLQHLQIDLTISANLFRYRSLQIDVNRSLQICKSLYQAHRVAHEPPQALSTSRGIMTDRRARLEGIGGENAILIRTKI